MLENTGFPCEKHLPEIIGPVNVLFENTLSRNTDLSQIPVVEYKQKVIEQNHTQTAY